MLKFQVGDRKTGKTTLALQWMKEAPQGEFRMMVCANSEMADQTFNRSEEMKMGLTRNQFISFAMVRGGLLKGRKNVKLCIDNIDLILNQIFEAPVEYVTATGEEVIRFVI